jgi:hypothetical protein
MAGLRPTFENVFGAQRMMNGNLVRTAEQATQVNRTVIVHDERLSSGCSARG